MKNQLLTTPAYIHSVGLNGCVITKVSHICGQVVENVVNTFWRGHLLLAAEGTGDTLHLPECVVQCICGQPALGTNSKQVIFFFTVLNIVWVLSCNFQCTERLFYIFQNVFLLVSFCLALFYFFLSYNCFQTFGSCVHLAISCQ